jgi:hypothetical protein
MLGGDESSDTALAPARELIANAASPAMPPAPVSKPPRSAARRQGSRRR